MAAAACDGEAAAATRALCAFSPRDRRFFAISGSDGRLRVWETANSRLQHEYVPSAHLSAACTCLAWAPPGGRPPPSKVRAVCEGREGSRGDGHRGKGTVRWGRRRPEQPRRVATARSASPRPPGTMWRGVGVAGHAGGRDKGPDGKAGAPLGSATGLPPPRGAWGVSTRDGPPGRGRVGRIRSPQRKGALALPKASLTGWRGKWH